MKAIVITLLICFSFCMEMPNLKKLNFSSFASAKTGASYIDISEYKLNDEIHLVFYVLYGEMDKKIRYGFSDPIPTIDMEFPYEIDTTSSEYYCVSEYEGDDVVAKECGHKYYYDIKKVENKRYIYIRYTGMTGTSITYEKMSLSATHFYIIYAVIAVVCVAGCVIYVIIQRKRRARNMIGPNSTPNQTPIMPQ